MSMSQLFKLDTHELAWAAGFFDGEGTTHFHPNGLPQLSIGQVDREPLERFQRAVLGLGRIVGPYKDTSKRKPITVYRVSNWRGAQAVIALLWKFLSTAKRQQAVRVFQQRQAHIANLKRPYIWPDGRQSVCSQGHPLDDAYVYPSGSRQCRTCRMAKRKDACSCGAAKWKSQKMCRACFDTKRREMAHGRILEALANQPMTVSRLAEAAHMSKTAVRESLRRLQQEGLVVPFGQYKEKQKTGLAASTFGLTGAEYAGLVAQS